MPTLMSLDTLGRGLFVCLFCLWLPLQEYLESLDPSDGRTDKEMEDFLYKRSLELEPRNKPLLRFVSTAITHSRLPLRGVGGCCFFGSSSLGVLSSGRSCSVSYRVSSISAQLCTIFEISTLPTLPLPSRLSPPPVPPRNTLASLVFTQNHDVTLSYYSNNIVDKTLVSSLSTRSHRLLPFFTNDPTSYSFPA